MVGFMSLDVHLSQIRTLYSHKFPLDNTFGLIGVLLFLPFALSRKPQLSLYRNTQIKRKHLA